MKKFYILTIICAISVTLGIYIIHNNNNKYILPSFQNPTSNNSDTPEVKPNKYSKIDDILGNQSYTSPADYNNEVCSVEIYNLEEEAITSINQYTAAENDSFDISIKSGETFIISLPTLPTVTYSWKILNSIDNNLLKLDHTSSVLLNSDDTNSDDTNPDEFVYGSGNSLQNFYFSALNSGSQTINFELNSDAYKSTDNFRVNFNIKVVK